MPFAKQVLAFDRIVRFIWDAENLKEAVSLAILPDWAECVGKPDTVFELRSLGEKVNLFQDGCLRSGSVQLPYLAEVLRKKVHIDLATHSRQFVFVHAGVVDTPFGLLVFPGSSRSGKSTLLKALLDLDGVVYYSDEYAVVDQRGQVRPFPRPMAIRLVSSAQPWLGGPKIREYHQALDLRWNPELPPKSAHYVFFTEYQPQACWAPSKLSVATAVFRLLQYTVSAKRDPVRALRFLTALVVEAQTYESARDEAALFSDLNWLPEVLSRTD